jgi:hypothetical protein
MSYEELMLPHEDFIETLGWLVQDSVMAMRDAISASGLSSEAFTEPFLFGIELVAPE